LVENHVVPQVVNWLKSFLKIVVSSRQQTPSHIFSSYLPQLLAINACCAFRLRHYSL